MASTMTIPHLAALPTFHGNMGNPIPGPMHGGMPGNIQGGFPGHIPVTLQQPMMSGPVLNGNNSPVSPPVQLRVPVVPVGGGCYNDGMEVVWHGEFSRLFSSFFPPHVWYLSITNSAPQEKWKFYRDSAKVRFCCQDCGNGWTSMKGRVTFWFHLNLATNEGFVQFKLYGQVCKKCNSGKFEYVMWYPEEVSKVMCNLYNKVGQTFYGFMQPPIRIDRRPGRPRNQHNADLCQACRDGECDQGRPVKALYNYIPPNVPRPGSQNLPPRSQIPPSSMAQVNPSMSVIIRQPPGPPSGQVIIQPPINSSTAQVACPVVAGPHSGHSLITAPVTLTSGVQPILTYSIVTDTAKEAPIITPDSDAFFPPTTSISQLSINDPPLPAMKSQCEGDTTPTTTFTTASKLDVTAAKVQMINGISQSPTKEGLPMKPVGVHQNHNGTNGQIGKKPVTNGTDLALKPNVAGITPTHNPNHVTPLTNGHTAPATGKGGSKVPEVIHVNGGIKTV